VASRDEEGGVVSQRFDGVIAVLRHRDEQQGWRRSALVVLRQRSAVL
jgi:hypothetical protein